MINLLLKPKSMIFFVFLNLLGYSIVSPGFADAPKTKSEPALEHPSFAEVPDDPKLPRVLLIGDSLSMQYTLDVRKLLKGVANVHRPAVNCHSTLQVMDELNDYLGDEHWDVVHFNCGIHDITHLGPDGKATGPPVGNIRVPFEEYKKNLKTIVARLKKTDAKLIWATTTPVTAKYQKERGYRRNADVVKYNEAAAKIMKSNGVAINDLYGALKPNDVKLLKDGVHTNPAGTKVTSTQVADAIRKALTKAAPAEK